MIFIIAWILCAGSSRKAAPPPPPQAPRLLCRCQVFLLRVLFLVVMMIMMVMMVVIMVVFFRGSQRCLHRRWNERTKKARRNDSPSLGRGKRWIHFMSWSNCLCFCWSNASSRIMSKKTFTFTFSSKLSLFWPTNQSFSAAMERWGWHREEFAKSVNRNFPSRSGRLNQLVLRSVSIGRKYYLHLNLTVEKETLHN